MRDVVATAKWLEENAAGERVETFLVGLEAVARRLAAFPLSGSPRWGSARYLIRMLALPGPLPYVVFYAHARADRVAEVILLRLFGAGQDRPTPGEEWLR